MAFLTEIRNAPKRNAASTRRRREDTKKDETGRFELPGLVEDERLIVKSLQMHHDERYDTMDHYRMNGGTADKEGHFARICARNRRMHGLAEEKKTVSEGDQLHDIAAREVEDENFDDTRLLRIASASVSKRVDWQESFDRSVKRLFVDFELTESAGCRLNHLDRMHVWFQEHGGKQIRKAKKGPGYITVDAQASPLPGSARILPLKSPGASADASQPFMTTFRSPALSARSKPG